MTSCIRGERLTIRRQRLHSRYRTTPEANFEHTLKVFFSLPMAKFVFHILLYLEKHCFQKLILNY